MMNRPQSARARWIGLGLTLLAAVCARMYAYCLLGVRFDAEPLNFYLQFIDPELLRTHLWQSLYYLHEQPPLFNLFLGVVLKVAPHDYALVFNACFIVLGLALTAALYGLLLKLKVPTLVATVISLLYAVHPTTLLFENWLLYEYVIAALLILAAAFLYGYLSTNKTRYGAAFFLMLALIVWTRGTFHPLWMILILAALAALPGMRWTAVMRCGIPFVLLALLPTAKNYFLYGDLLTGATYGKFNYSGMRTRHLPPQELQRLIADGTLSRASGIDFYGRSVLDYADLLPPLQNTGIPLLDTPLKSTGAPNWHHHGMTLVANLYYQDARLVAGRYPHLYWESVQDNFFRCLQPANECVPFNQPDYANAIALRPWLDRFNRVFAGQIGAQGPGWITALALLLVIPYWTIVLSAACWRIVRHRNSAPEETARLGLLLFCFFNFVYVCATTIALSHDDQNRYRFAAMPLFLILAAAMALDLTTRWRANNRPAQ